MFTVTRQNDTRLNLLFGGKIGSDEMDAGLDDLLGLSQDMTDGRLLYEIADFRWPGFGAIGGKLGRIPELRQLLGRFTKVAVVTDKSWIRSLVRCENILFRRIEMKPFQPQDSAQAEAWLAA